ncbi:DUF6153 family protein [Streptomyces clavifer]|uniref:DUF6153 family protein n=1 Tax=Streptomyces clavifer TaxID=68188 RepID=UPI0037A2F6BD
MSQQAWCAVRPGGARLYVLLLLAVLAGLVAMHGLGPVASSSSSSATPVDRHTITTAASSHSGTDECGDCAHVGHDDSGAGGHAEHADATCAASGTSTGPALPALAPAGLVACPAGSLPGPFPEPRPGGRAPPSLSELQLLRI